MSMRVMDASLAAFGDDPRFTGAVAGVHLSPSNDPQLHAYVVTSEPGARTAWHSHDRGQLIICIAGRGHVGTRDGQVVELIPGVAVWTDAGDEHWHGASDVAPMTNVAVQTETLGIDSVRWLEAVTDDLYGAASR